MIVHHSRSRYLSRWPVTAKSQMLCFSVFLLYKFFNSNSIFYNKMLIFMCFMFLVWPYIQLEWRPAIVSVAIWPSLFCPAVFGSSCETNCCSVIKNRKTRSSGIKTDIMKKQTWQRKKNWLRGLFTPKECLHFTPPFVQNPLFAFKGY